jgi:ribosomal protein S18 acetylase RimI-like enzyme
MWAALAHMHRVLAERVPGGEVAEVDGHLLTAMPLAPDSPWQNVAIPVLPGARHERLAAWFEGRCERWGVWAQQGAAVTGLRVEAESLAMAADLAALDLSGARGEPVDLARVGAVNDIVYAILDGHLERITPYLEGAAVGFGLEDASVALCCEYEGDAGIHYVATLPEARRRGLARAVVSRALAHARETGCRTASLQASESGAPLYEAIGFRRVAAIALFSV